MFYSPACCDLNTWFELSRVKLYRNDLKETEITSSLREVRVTEGKIIVNESTVLLSCITFPIAFFVDCGL